MTPIEKNIRVVDEQGNEYEATYPKRAKGLVKNGRARFVDEHTICLACPPNQMEESVVSNTTKSKEKLTINYVLNQIERIIRDNDYIHNALEQLAAMPKSDPGDIAGQEKAKAIGDIVRCREATNQQALRLYEKMLDDLKNDERRKVESINAAFSGHLEEIDKCELNNEDKFAAIGEVTCQIAELTDRLLSPRSTSKELERLLMKLACIIENPNAPDSAKMYASEVLNSYMEWNTDK